MSRRGALVWALGWVLLAVLAVVGCSGAGDRSAAGGSEAAVPSSGPGAGTGAAPTTAGRGTGAAPGSEGGANGPTTTRAGTPGAVRYRFPVAGCDVRYGRAHHDYPAADMFAGRGCAFVAPVAGRVDEVSRSDRWSSSSDLGADRGGRSVSLVGVDGVRYYGSHLEAVAPGIVPGVTVRAGQLLGRVGDSGSAKGTGTHLHFGISWPTRPGIWWVRRGVVPPAPFLDSWRAGGNRSPVGQVRAARAAAGRAVPPCRARC
jgi:peptidoglycan LD-endopeptidase LytH